MNKLKHLIIVALIALLAGGVAVGCTVDSGIPSDQPHKVIYCANGGDIAGKAERYVNYQDKSPLPEPGAGTLIAEPTREHYVFKGWAIGSLDADGNPAYASSAKYLDDGGVWYNKYDEPDILSKRVKEKHGDKASYETSEVHFFYDYDASKSWDFRNDVVTESIVLVAMWEKENEYVVTADTTKTFSDIKSDFAIKGFDLNLASYVKSLNKPVSGNSVKPSELVTAFDEDAANVYFTAYEFFTSADKTAESKIGDSYTLTESLTVFYANYLDGSAKKRKVAYVTDYKGFESAVKANKDIYIANDIVLGKRESYRLSDVDYKGAIDGAGHSISGIEVDLSQVQRFDDKSNNAYGVLFNELADAELKNITFNVNFNFEIGVNPDDWNDRYSASYQGLTKELFKEYNRSCRIGLIASKITGSTLTDVTVNGTYNVTRTSETNREKTEDGKWVNVERYNNYDVTVTLIGLQGYKAADDDAELKNTITSCSIENVTFGKADEAGGIVPEN